MMTNNMASRFFSHLPVKVLSGIGSALEAKLAKLDIYTVQDLLLHFPLRYEDHFTNYPINDVTVGQLTTIEGEIVKTEIVPTGRRKMLLCYIQDDSGVAILRFMNFNSGIKASLAVNKWVSAYGEIKLGKRYLEIIHPQFKIIPSKEIGIARVINERCENVFTPIYPTTFGLAQHVIRKLIHSALLLLKQTPPTEILPKAISQNWPSAEQALSIIHQPSAEIDTEQLTSGSHPAIRRFIIEELLAYHLSMLIVKSHNQKQLAHQLRSTQKLQTQFLSALPFTPTGAQLRVVNDIYQDMEKPLPMMRLIQGDVGSGKTVVAALAALVAIENNKQVALMAPTEILAEQHVVNFKKWFEPLGITVCLLSGKLTAKNKKAVYDSLSCGEITMLIGTHAVFVDHVQFHDLGLVIIDEQHRFGVNQRLALLQKGIKEAYYPHQLIMTATPIPRTLSMTVYADLDVSIIDELPPGRTLVQTVVISNLRRQEILARVEQACKKGRQVYWVCTLVEESEQLNAQAAEKLVEELKLSLPELTISLVHGRMKSIDKQNVMQSFTQGEIQLLVATTVIEVGVDVPNASLMIIENAERLGLSQLHQLRGRVGRGTEVSHCVLMYQSPLSKIAQQRMQVMRETNDGFIIAQKDLEIRGSGEILGTRQIGVAHFNVVDLIRDQHMIAEVKKLSSYLQKKHPETVNKLIECWLPHREKYRHA